jgi:hypothetical protein
MIDNGMLAIVANDGKYFSQALQGSVAPDIASSTPSIGKSCSQGLRQSRTGDALPAFASLGRYLSQEFQYIAFKSITRYICPFYATYFCL